MGRRPQTQVGAPRPVAGIMSGTKARQGEVGYFIMIESGGCQPPGQPVVQCGAEFFVRLLPETFLQAAVERHFRLQAQQVGRNVLYSQTEGQGKAVFETLRRLPRQAHHQVDTDVVVAFFPATADGFNGLSGRMAPADKGQLAVGEALDTDAQTVDGQGLQAFQIVRAQIVRIGLQGDFSPRQQREGPGDVLEYAAQLGGAEQ